MRQRSGLIHGELFLIGTEKLNLLDSLEFPYGYKRETLQIKITHSETGEVLEEGLSYEANVYTKDALDTKDE